MNDEKTARALSALGHPIRLALYRRLVATAGSGDGPVALAAQVGLPRNLISYHLQPLVAAGLVRSERRGRDVNYRVVPAGLTDLVTDLLRLAAAEGD